MVENGCNFCSYGFPGKRRGYLVHDPKSAYADEIFKKYLAMEEVRRQIAVRNDFKAAFNSVKHGWELSSDLDYSMSKKTCPILQNCIKLENAEEK